MRSSIIYFILGIMFTYMAVISITDTIWNITTILLLLVAALDFGVGIRYLRTDLARRKNEKE